MKVSKSGKEMVDEFAHLEKIRKLVKKPKCFGSQDCYNLPCNNLDFKCDFQKECFHRTFYEFLGEQ